jgi:hypothetical protein
MIARTDEHPFLTHEVLPARTASSRGDRHSTRADRFRDIGKRHIFHVQRMVAILVRTAHHNTFMATGV